MKGIEEIQKAERRFSTILQKGEEEMETPIKEEKKEKSTGLKKFIHFLAYGGWLLVLIVILAIVIFITILTK